ncbi:MAG: hypothetical protein LBV52_03435 [Spirochaetaceae bacterium]|nr:hypothetical protein [Spirochaetaceae bacterium]
MAEQSVGALPKEFVRESGSLLHKKNCPRMTRISANEKTCHSREGGNLREQFSAAVPSVIRHDFRKIWFWTEKAGRWCV